MPHRPSAPQPLSPSAPQSLSAARGRLKAERLGVENERLSTKFQDREAIAKELIRRKTVPQLLTAQPLSPRAPCSSSASRRPHP